VRQEPDMALVRLRSEAFAVPYAEHKRAGDGHSREHHTLLHRWSPLRLNSQGIPRWPSVSLLRLPATVDGAVNLSHDPAEADHIAIFVVVLIADRVVIDPAHHSAHQRALEHFHPQAFAGQ